MEMVFVAPLDTELSCEAPSCSASSASTLCSTPPLAQLVRPGKAEHYDGNDEVEQELKAVLRPRKRPRPQYLPPMNKGSTQQQDRSEHRRPEEVGAAYPYRENRRHRHAKERERVKRLDRLRDRPAFEH